MIFPPFARVSTYLTFRMVFGLCQSEVCDGSATRARAKSPKERQGVRHLQMAAISEVSSGLMARTFLL